MAARTGKRLHRKCTHDVPGGDQDAPDGRHDLPADTASGQGRSCLLRRRLAGLRACGCAPPAPRPGWSSTPSPAGPGAWSSARRPCSTPARRADRKGYARSGPPRPGSRRREAHGRVKAAETFGALLPRFLERQRARLKPRSIEETRATPDGARQATARPPIDSHRPPHDRDPTGRDRQGKRPGRQQPGAHLLSAFFTWARARAMSRAIRSPSPTRRSRTDRASACWRMPSWRRSGARRRRQYGAIVKLLMLTGARRDEIASLRWTEVDLDTATVTLPPARTKNRREHVIPLSDRRSRSWRRNHADRGRRDRTYLRSRRRGFQDWSGSKADLDARIAAARKGRALDWRCTIPAFALDRPARAFGVPPHVVEAILGHVGVLQGRRRRRLQQGLYLDERRRPASAGPTTLLRSSLARPRKLSIVNLRRPKRA